jgi:rSAM/selenodomain-associated transferase 1
VSFDRLVVMARVPEPGRTKTRLVPALGAEGAARLAAAMAADVFALAARTGLPWSIALDGDSAHPWVRTLPAPWEPQAAGDLGARLTFALRGGGIAIGADAPDLPAATLLLAARSPARVVLAPAADGGYVLVATDDPTGLFEDIPWSSDRTFAAQHDQARRLGRTVALLPKWYDVDTADDLAGLRARLADAPHIAPHTSAFLRDPAHAPPHW